MKAQKGRQAKAKTLTKAEKEHATRILAKRELDYLTSVFHKFENWWPRYSAAHPDETCENIIKSIRARREMLLKEVTAELQRGRQRGRDKLAFKKHHATFREKQAEKQAASKGSAMKQLPPPHPQWIPMGPQNFPEYSMERAYGSDIAQIVMMFPRKGVVRPNDLMFYLWDLPDRDNTWQDFDYDYMHDPEGFNTRTWFTAGFRARGGFPMSASDSIAQLPTFQVEFPAAPYDATILYYTHAFMRIPTGCTVIDDWGRWDDKDWGFLDIDFVIKEDASGGDFPSFESLAWSPGIHVSETTRNSLSAEEIYYGMLDVARGVSAKVFIGFSIQLMGADSLVYTGSNPDYMDWGYLDLRVPDWVEGYDDFYGVYYVMMPK